MLVFEKFGAKRCFRILFQLVFLIGCESSNLVSSARSVRQMFFVSSKFEMHAFFRKIQRALPVELTRSPVAFVARATLKGELALASFLV